MGGSCVGGFKLMPVSASGGAVNTADNVNESSFAANRGLTIGRHFVNARPATAAPSVHPTYARMLCLTLRGLGLDVDAVLRSAGLPPWSVLATSDDAIDQAAVNRLVVSALAASGRPWLGIEVGSTVQVSAHGPLGFAVATSRNLAQALETIVRFGALRFGSVRYLYQPTPGGAVVSLVEVVDLGDSRVFVTCMVFATLVQVMAAVVGPQHPPVAVDFPFPEPPWRAQLEGLCRGRLRFGQPNLAVHLDDATLHIPCVTADAQGHAVAVAQCEQLARQAALGPITQRVLDWLNDCEERYPALPEVAERFGVSERTLMRHLKQEGSRYQALLDGARQHRALLYLQHSTLPVEDIAARLGFEDTSNFSRTFKRWFGRLPSEVRRLAARGAKLSA